MRLFAGVALDEATRAVCGEVIDELQRSGFAARFEERDKLHVTLAFLGNVDSERRGEIVRVMDETAAATGPFDLTFDKVGAFPHERSPRIVYVGAREQGRDYRLLCARLRGGFGELGFRFKDDAVAHVTVARIKDLRRPLPLVGVAPATLRVSTLTLFESLPDKEKNTSRYIASATSELRGTKP
ncbi:MAG TPA: RNA 2',3'-cyclic phosphodiesterase [Candidatus Baltobacteraceae bacterium]|nr:RNA 2',3'-cyclic phosphodiesterase [Candidatus Baltobacteraceae bacterium]